jgi:hypothetical protein
MAGDCNMPTITGILAFSLYFSANGTAVAK